MVPSIFFTRTTGEAHGLLEGSITSSSSISRTWSRMTSLSFTETRYGDWWTGYISSLVAMRCFATVSCRTFYIVAKQFLNYLKTSLISCCLSETSSSRLTSSFAGAVLFCCVVENSSEIAVTSAGSRRSSVWPTLCHP